MISTAGPGSRAKIVQFASGREGVAGIKVGICGQAPSNYPDFAEFLVREGIDSISLNPDSFVKTCAVIAAAEQAAK